MLTLLEASKVAAANGDVYLSGIIEHYANSSPFLNAFTFSDIAGNALKYNREETLPGVGFRGVNEGYSESTGILNPVTETLAIAGGDLDVDKFILDTQGQQHRTIHEGMKIKALARSMERVIIKGDNESNPKEISGLQARIQNNQRISAGTTSGGAALSLSKLDELIDLVDDPTHLVMNNQMALKMAKAQRNSSVAGFITFTIDIFGRTGMTYNGLPIIVVRDDNLGNPILPFTEASSSGAATSTSVYCLSMGPGGVQGIQNGGIVARDLGELEAKPTFRTRVEWYVGMAIYKGRAAARLQHVGNLDIVA